MRLLGYFLPNKTMVSVAIFALCIFSLVDAGMIYFIQPLIDDGLAKADADMLKFAALMVVAIFFSRGLFSFIASYTMSYTSTQIVFTVRQQVFSHLQCLPMTYFDRTSTGKLISKLIYDAEQVAGATSEALMVCLRESVIVVVLLAIMFSASWQLSLVFLLLGPLIGWLIALVSRRFRRVSQSMQRLMGDISIQAEESLRSHKDVLAFSAQAVQQEKFRSINRANRQQAMKLATVSAVSNPVIQFIASLAIAGILFLASFETVLMSLSVGTFTTVLVAMGSLLRPLKQLSKVNQQLQKGLAAADSLFAILDEQVESNPGKGRKADFQHSIQISGLHFSYPGAKTPALRNIDMIVPKGLTLAIVGESGSGKSTLTDLLLRLYAAPKNSILLDNDAIEECDLHDYRSLFSVVSQHPYLIDDTLESNITYGIDRHVSASEIKRVVNAAQLQDVVARMPDGMSSKVGENGARLSGGQRQRIAIARALLRQSPILVLDEATSALDGLTEHRIYQNIARMGREQTIIIVTHRLRSIENADHIAVMHQGNLVQQGSHLELVSQSGTYAQLYATQNSTKSAQHACA